MIPKEAAKDPFLKMALLVLDAVIVYVNIKVLVSMRERGLLSHYGFAPFHTFKWKSPWKPLESGFGPYEKQNQF